MDIIDQLGSNDLAINLRACDFRIDEKGLAHMWVHQTSIGPTTPHVTQATTPITIAPTTDLTSTSQDDDTMHPFVARCLLREHVPRSLKCEIQMFGGGHVSTRR